MEAAKQIAGAEKLLAVFGYWPSFHDAEVLWLRLDRRGLDDGCYGPTLEALVYVFESTSEVSPEGYFVLRHHSLIHLRFLDVVEIQLDGFNHQNAIMGLSFTDLRDRQMERVRWEVHFDVAFGLNASFQCYAIKVVSVVPCSKSGEPIYSEPGSASDRDEI